MRNFPLMALESLEIQGGLYMKLQDSISNKAFFTSLSNNLNKLYFETHFPFVINSMDSSIKLSLAGVIFGEYCEDSKKDANPNDNSKFVPWEMLNFEWDLKEIEDKAFFISQKHSISKCQTSEKFQEFLKKGMDSKNISYFKVFIRI